MNTPSVVLSSLLLATTFSGSAPAQLVPAGSLIQCTISEPKLSSKTEALGDPISCLMTHGGRYGRYILPYGSDVIVTPTLSSQLVKPVLLLSPA